MSVIWVVISNRTYDGDTLYGVFNSKKRAEEVKEKINEPDVEIRELIVNEVYPLMGGI